MRIAIVGSGISGLTCAHLLHARHEVTLYEADARLGGHTNTVDVELGGERHAIDTGFIVYNESTYPNFVRLLARLGVETQPSDMSFGLTCERTGIEWASRGLRSVFARPSNALRPRFLLMLRDVLRFNREAPALLAAEHDKVTLGDYLCGAGYSEAFVEHYVVPMGAAIWSAEPAAFLRFPAASFVRFFANHGLLETSPRLQWRAVRGGSARYVERLVAPFRGRVRTACRVRAVRRAREGVEVFTAGERRSFDHVILALHSDQALRVLADASPAERSLLGSISYRANDVVLHTDASILPRRRRAWASWNYRVPRASRDGVLVTYDMNRLQGIASRHRFLVTLNAADRIDPARVLGRFRYEHPVFDAAAMAAQKHHGAISGRGGLHYAGAYWGWGFHEDGVRSALAVCEKLGARL